MNTGSDLPPFLLSKKVWAAAVAVVVVIVVWSTIVWVNKIDNKGYEKQRDVVTLYQGVKTTLSNCLDKSMQSAGIADRERNSLKDIMIGTAYARAGSGSDDTGDSMLDINAVREAYPNVTPDLYRQLMTTVNGCRDEVAGAQRDLQAYGGEFQKWTETGGPLEKQFRGRYPTSELTAVNGEGKTIFGIEALDFIVTPIILGSAEDASRTKEMPSQQLFPSGSPSNS